MKRKNGFSLVEVIIAISIIGLIGVITSTILARSFRAGTQTDTLSKLKQNGDVALNMIDQAIRNSEGVICYGGTVRSVDSIVVRSRDGIFSKFRFKDPVIANGKVTQNGYIVKQNNLNPADYANFCTSQLASPPEIQITDGNPSSGVSVSGGKFEKIAGTGGRHTVTITFNVNPSLSLGGTGASETVKIQTTVQIR